MLDFHVQNYCYSFVYIKYINKEEKVTTIMVTHDPVSASYCSRILFIKDGVIYNQLYRGDSRQQFYQEIIDVLRFFCIVDAEGVVGIVLGLFCIVEDENVVVNGY